MALPKHQTNIKSLIGSQAPSLIILSGEEFAGEIPPLKVPGDPDYHPELAGPRGRFSWVRLTLM